MWLMDHMDHIMNYWELFKAQHVPSWYELDLEWVRNPNGEPTKATEGTEGTEGT